MANNRLYIGCKECREWLYLDKHFGDSFQITENRLEELNDFLDKHAYCGRRFSISFELFDECTDDIKTWRYYMEQTEPQTDCYVSDLCKHYGDKQICGRCRSRNLFCEKDEPQTEREGE